MHGKLDVGAGLKVTSGGVSDARGILRQREAEEMNAYKR